MEQGKGTKSSSSSELSGSKVPPSSNSRILDSTFPPQSKSLAGKRQDSLNELLNTKPGSSGEPSKGNEGESRNVATGKVGPIFQEQCIPPCTLSSSIFYGGQDNYPLPKTKQDSVYNDEDDSGYATRGNWWKGSVYY
ncbi:Salt Induced Serine rich [Hibiscus trionum]|uniref:Salt Induced Serine rich n=1 Tax=Hibiscus trionum TaxID=183268 RepID=A0A9W7H4D1_HIBTR|nr:Salt Induced Serine rich [Hibiscus trionum]